MRIVGGVARGRRLALPAPATRPTSDRVRESMFNALAARIRLDGARVLDLYAGTGAVGLEALSRGAATAVLVESNRRALQVIHRNVETVGLPGARVVASPVNAFLHGDPDEPFALVFADPPYDVDDTKIGGILVALDSRGWLADDGMIVVERPHSLRAVGDALDSVTTADERRYGDTVLWYGRRR